MVRSSAWRRRTVTSPMHQPSRRRSSRTCRTSSRPPGAWPPTNPDSPTNPVSSDHTAQARGKSAMTSITMPQLGESVAEGTIGKWLKAPGERIERDEPLVEVITDKVTAEIPSPVEGVVERLVIEEGQTVAVGSEIAIIADPGGSASGAPAPSLATVGGPTMDSLSGPPTPPAPRAAAVVAP